MAASNSMSEQDLRPLPTHGAQGADLLRTLENAHHHGVRNSQNSDHECKHGSSPCGSLGKFDELIVAGALGRGNRLQARQCRFNLSLRALDVVLPRLASRGRAQAHVNRRNLALHAAQLLKLIERHDHGVGFECRTAVVDARHRKRRPLDLQSVAGLFLQPLRQNIAQHHLRLAVTKSPS